MEAKKHENQIQQEGVKFILEMKGQNKVRARRDRDGAKKNSYRTIP